MEHNLEYPERLLFSDLIGTFQVMDDLIFLPKLEGLSNLKSLRDASTKMNILSNSLFNGKSIITHGTLGNRDFLFYYSDEGVFKSKRIYNDKVEELSFFKYVELRLVVFVGKEIELIGNKVSSIRHAITNYDTDLKSPVLAAVFYYKSLRSTTYCSHILHTAFPDLEAIVYVDHDHTYIEKTKGSMILC